MNTLFSRLRTAIIVAAGWLLTTGLVRANVPGGGTGTGPNVTLANSGSGNVTIGNGIVSIICNTNSAQITTINYTFNNTGSSQTLDLLAGGNNGGLLYWENNNNQGCAFTYSVIANPASNGGKYAEIALTTTTVANIVLEVHYSLLRGATGFYVTAIWAHRATDGPFSFGECRDNIYAGSIFNWMSVDATRNKLMPVSGGAATGVYGAPPEVSLWTSGIYAGQYEDKYKYSANFGDHLVWGWSSVGTGGKNVGLWNISASAEYYNGGPLKRELMEHMGTTILNMLNGGHYGQGGDGSFASGEVWTKVCGPYFIYCNNVSSSITGTNAVAQALYHDALAQGAAEKSAWPYAWFSNTNYAAAARRGTVTGKIVIADPGNPNASASNLWVGLVRQPATTTGAYDFQAWMKPYQFWVKSDANGSFTIPNVIATNNYTLYAFGPGAPAMFMSQSQTGGNPPLLLDLPAAPFSVTVSGGATNDLHTVTWTPARVGATVFQIGYPSRVSDKFRHGDDWWVGGIGPSTNTPLPVWSKWLEYPFDFPGGPNYVVGQSRWSTDWNFCQPVVADSAGNYNNSSSAITFNLATAPTNGATASLYLGLSSDYYAAIIVTVNNTNLGSVSGVTGSPNNSIPTTGYYAGYGKSDTTIREGNQAMASDERVNFPASLLHAGTNTLSIGIRQVGGSYFADHAMYDYIRLELTGYVPPPPSSVTAYPGNNCNLVCWPVVPGATSYKVLRSTTSGGGYSLVTNGVVGPVCGSGLNNASWLDTTAINGTTYFYVVQSSNPGGSSTNSPQSSGATPNGGLATSPPAAPAGLTIGGTGHQSVTLNWSAASGADFYTIYRSTLFNNGGGASNVLGTIVLDNALTGTSYTDTLPSDGGIYRYFVTATGAGGTSSNSSFAVAVPLPAPPTGAPGSPTQTGAQTNSVTLSWNAVSGAVGYIVKQAASPDGPFTFLASVTETTYTARGLNPGTAYYFQVTAVNAGGVSTNATLTTITLPPAPANLTANPGDSQVVLNWPPATGATGYYLLRGTSSGNETVAVAANYSGTTYTNTGLANGTNYYYVVAATNAAGLGPDSPEASTTPSANVIAGGRDLVWRGDGSANLWNTRGAANWLSNTTVTVFTDGDAVTFNDLGSNNVPVTIAGTPAPALVTVDASKDYTFSGGGSISGTNALIKSSSGTLTISTTNFYSGGTIISNGVIAGGNIGANNAAWGAGPIYFYGGTVQFDGYGSSSTGTGWGGCTNALIVPDGQTGTLLLPPRWGYSYPFTSPLTGGGTLNVTVDYIRDYFSGDWSGFNGRLIASARGNSGDFRIDNTHGYAGASIYLNSGVNFYTVNHNNLTVDIGELGGDNGAFIGSGSLSASNPTWRIGGKNTTNTYAGTIADAGVTSLVKAGTGALTLSGTNNTYSGGTTVNAGLLLVNNAVGSGTGTGNVTVNAGGTLGGDGIISGPVAINANGALAPGNPFGALTISNDLTMATGSTLLIQVQHAPLTNSAVNVGGTLYADGTLQVTNRDALTAGDSFHLFSADNFSGSFAKVVLPVLTGNLAWNTNTLQTAGTISVVALTSPTIFGVQISGNKLIISGTGGADGWPFYVLTATNLATGPWTPLTTNQFNSAGDFAVTNTVRSEAPQMYFRLQLQ